MKFIDLQGTICRNCITSYGVGGEHGLGAWRLRMLEEMMLEKKVWAVVGANQDHEKYGNMIYRKLKSRGFQVYPVNPLYEEVEGDICYKDLASLPVVPEVINMVVSPKRGKSVLNEAAMLGVRNIWLQPGTYDDELMAQIKELNLQAVQACVLVATR